MVVFTTSYGLESPLVIDRGQLVLCVAPRSRPRTALSFFAAERRWLRRLIAQHPCDLVHAMWSYQHALAAMQSGLPTVVHYRDHALTILRHTPDAYRLLRWLLSAHVTFHSRFRIANSDYLRAAFGRRGRAMQVVPNFLPQGLIPATTPHAATAREPVITVANGLSHHKNVLVGLQAFALLRQQGVAAEYRLVGTDMQPGGPAESLAKKNDLAEGVVFLGRLPLRQTLAEISAAALLLHPSLEESFGMTVLEAMTLGTPVVAGRSTGNLPELLDQGRCGFLCDVRDPEDVARVAAVALTHSAETQGMVANARARSRDVYSEERVMRQLEDYYVHMLGDVGAYAAAG